MARSAGSYRREAAHLRAEGYSLREVVTRWRETYGLNTRVAYRLAHGLTQADVAQRWNEQWPDAEYPKTGKQISYWEIWPGPAGRQPSPETLNRLALLYRCSAGELLDGADYSGPEHATPGAGADKTAVVASRPAESGGVARLVRPEPYEWPLIAESKLDTPDEIEQRRQWLRSIRVDLAKLGYLEGEAEKLIRHNERRAPSEVATQACMLRRHIDEMIRAPQHPPFHQRLFVVAARLSGLLAALALDLGRAVSARLYAAEAYDLGSAAGSVDTQAWARANQSLVEYYQHRYHDALAFARAGQRLDPNGPHRVRLAINGEARALARLGDRRGAEEAIDRAMALVRRDPTSSVTESLSLGPYCEYRAAANAATAYLSLGLVERVEGFGRLALPAFDAAGLHGPQALTRLDLATARLMAPNPDL